MIQISPEHTMKNKHVTKEQFALYAPIMASKLGPGYTVEYYDGSHINDPLVNDYILTVVVTHAGRQKYGCTLLKSLEALAQHTDEILNDWAGQMRRAFEIES